MILFDRAVALVNLVFYLSSSIIRNVLIDFEDLDLFVPVGVDPSRRISRRIVFLTFSSL